MLAESVGVTTNHLAAGMQGADKRIARQIEALLTSFGGTHEECACIVVGAAGVDSPKEKAVVNGFYRALMFDCPVFCMNDGNVAFYAATRGLGVLAISGTGSVAVGRNKQGKITRSGGYPLTIFGNEGSGQWIALRALHHASMWIDGSVPPSLLSERLNGYFGGLNADSLVEYAVALRTRMVDAPIAVLVHEAAKAGDAAAACILKDAALALLAVAETCVKKLALDKEDHFFSGVWGSVFVKNELFCRYYSQEFTRRFPVSEIVFPDGDAADGATQLAIDYLRGTADFIAEL